MSMEAAKTFFEKVVNDEELRNELAGCKDTEQKLALAKSKGYEFTVDEINKVKTELSDQELDLIAGGGSGCYNPLASAAT